VANTLQEEGYVTLTEANNLKWKLDLPAGKQIELPFEYQVEWPIDTEINI